MSAYILGVDVGTTSVKAVLLETGSRSVAATQALPTTSDIIDHSGLKVSAFMYRTTLLRTSAITTLLCVYIPHVTRV